MFTNLMQVHVPNLIHVPQFRTYTGFTRQIIKVKWQTTRRMTTHQNSKKPPPGLVIHYFEWIEQENNTKSEQDQRTRKLRY